MLGYALSIERMTTARDPDEAAADRLAAIEATAGSADDIFDPDFLQALRQDWPD